MAINLLLPRLFITIVTLISLSVLPLLAKVAEATEIDSVSKLPSTVKVKMPRDGTTIFYGSVPKIGPQKQDVLIHFYSVPVKDKRILEVNSDAVNCTVNLFVRNGSKRSSKLQLLNSMQFYNWSKMVSEGDQVSVNLFWLVPATKQTPVINLSLNSSGAFHGYWTHDVLLVFNRGLQKPPVEATFFSASFSESSTSYSFGELDARGMMMVTTYNSQRVADQGADESHGALHWNGNGFS